MIQKDLVIYNSKKIFKKYFNHKKYRKMNMQNNIFISERRVYTSPELNVIRLDNEISLVLDSSPSINIGDPVCNPGSQEQNTTSPYD